MRNYLIKLLLPGFLLVAVCIASAQDITYARNVIDSLCSPTMAGRGYNQGQDKLAAAYIAAEFKRHGLNSFTDNFLQPFSINVNSINGNLSVAIDNKVLSAGKDYFISGSSTSCKGSYALAWLSTDDFSTFSALTALRKNNYKKSFLVVQLPASGLDSMQRALLMLLRRDNFLKARGCIFLHSDTMTSWETSAYDGQPPVYPVIDMNTWALPALSRRIQINLKTSFLTNYQTNNVIAYLPGQVADSFIVFTAHYDHLGSMGKETYFPGAHDNASGVAFILDLSRQLALAGTPTHSVCFIAFSGEEIGLAGSLHYCRQPLFPLKQIKQVINMDILATGSKGIMVQNCSQEATLCKQMDEINEREQHVVAIQHRANAANSDHYPFSLMQIPSVFIYTLGDEYKEYHSVNDKATNLPLTAYNGLFKLIYSIIK